MQRPRGLLWNCAVTTGFTGLEIKRCNEAAEANAAQNETRDGHRPDVAVCWGRMETGSDAGRMMPTRSMNLCPWNAGERRVQQALVCRGGGVDLH